VLALADHRASLVDPEKCASPKKVALNGGAARVISPSLRWRPRLDRAGLGWAPNLRSEQRLTLMPTE
jgi:hypothetical protein